MGTQDKLYCEILSYCFSKQTWDYVVLNFKKKQSNFKINLAYFLTKSCNSMNMYYFCTFLFLTPEQTFF